MPAFHIKSPVLPVKDQVAGAIQWDYDYAEVRADGIVHALGVVFSLVATTALVFIVTHYPTAVSISAVLVYAVGLLTMFAISAAYNLWPVSPRKWLLRRFDHSAIYLLIAATYTPFISQIDDQQFATRFLAGVWIVAFVGMALKVNLPGRLDRLSIVIYLGMGWSGFLAYHAVVASLSRTILMLIALGGCLYTFGVIFHSCQRLRFQNVIWHGFVFMGAACHYAAVLFLTIA